MKKIIRRLIGLFGFMRSLAQNEIYKNNEKYNVLISGGFGFQNTGDEAQLGANLKRWKEIKPDVEITVLSPDPDYTTQHHGIRSIYAPRVTLFNMLKSANYRSSNKKFKKQFRKVKRRLILTAYFQRAGIPLMFTHARESELIYELIKADILQISGGGFLTGKTSSRLWDNCLLMRLAYILGTPYLLTGQTIGVFQNKKNRKIAKWGLNNAKFIHLRDRGLSEKEILSLNLKCKNIQSLFDDALFCERISEDKIKEVLGKHRLAEKEKYVAVNYHFWGMDDETKSKATKRFAELCRYIKDKHNLSLVLIPMVPRDVDALKELNEMINNDAVLLEYDFDYRTVRGVISKAVFVLTMKHHPIIFAQGEGVPQISVALDDYYYRKNTGAMANCGQEKYCLDNNNFYLEHSENIIDEMVEKQSILKEEIVNWTNSIKHLDISQIETIFK